MEKEIERLRKDLIDREMRRIEQHPLL